jgi:hypothetical protein
MWQFAVPKPPPNLAARPEDWFSEGTPFDSPEDLVLALRAMPEAPGSGKRLRRFRRRFFQRQPGAAVRSRSRLRSFIFALLIVAVPVVAAQATSHNAVTADLHVHHTIGPGAKILAPSAVAQPSPQAGIVSGSNGNTSDGNASAPGGNAVVAQVAGTSVGTGAQPAPPPAQGVSTPTPPPPPPAAPNQLANPSFESNSNGWTSPDGILFRCNCATAKDGLWTMEVYPKTQLVGYLYSIVNSPGYTASAGQMYTASIWVRANTVSTLGQNVTLGVHDQTAGGSLAQLKSNSVKLSYTWQQVSVSITPKNGGDQLFIWTSGFTSASNQSFLVDEASLVAG